MPFLGNPKATPGSHSEISHILPPLSRSIAGTQMDFYYSKLPFQERSRAKIGKGGEGILHICQEWIGLHACDESMET